jgi:hypothetical protein
MRYLKLYENFSDNLYSEIDFLEWVANLNTLPISQDPINRIVDRLISGWEFVSKPKYNSRVISLVGDNDSSITIGYSDDEWWYCKYYNSEVPVNPTTLRYTFYKCDDIDGLLQLLKDLEIIN